MPLYNIISTCFILNITLVNKKKTQFPNKFFYNNIICNYNIEKYRKKYLENNFSVLWHNIYK